MQATIIELYEYLNKNSINHIPPYQRNYSWQIENCEQLFNDIVQSGRDESKEFHFIGSIIVVINAGIGKNTNIIIDGQQRITTSFLFLKAFYDVCEDENIRDEFIKRLIYRIHKDGRDCKLRLNKNDDEVLNKIIFEKQLNEDDEESKIFKNYFYFKNKILQFKDEEILKNGFEKLKIVGIELSQNDNPQAIFESLNSTGIQLNGVDLIRNYLLMNQNIENQKKLYEDYWYKIEKNLTQDFMLEFFRAFLSIKKEAFVGEKKIYEEFKNYVNFSEFKTEDIFEEILFYSSIYSNILFNSFKDEELNQKVKNITIFNQKTIFPFLTQSIAMLIKEELNKSEIFEIFDFFENYLIRNFVCEVPTNSYNKLNPVLIKALFANNPLENIKSTLIFKDTKFRMKNDKEFKEALKYSKIYKNKALQYGKVLLYKIEKNLNKKEFVKSENLSVEHIMPKTLTKDWKNELGDNFNEIYQEFLHTLGNLTLTAYNPELGNKSFDEKKELLNSSNLSLNRYFENIEVWDKKAIEKRADYLIDFIINNIYKQPKELNEVEFYKVDGFYLSNKDFKVTGSKPKGFSFFEKDFKVQTWSELYIAIVKIIYSENEELFERYFQDGKFLKLLALDKVENSSKRYVKINKIYLVLGLSTESILRNLSKFFEVLNIDENELYIELS